MFVECNKVIIADKEKEFYLLCYYDGKKEEVNIDDGELLLFYEYKNDYELWYYISSSQEILKEYLEGKIGILTLMNKSKVYLVRRPYYNFDVIVEFYEVDLNELNLPKNDIKFERNVYEIIEEFKKGEKE